MSLVRKIAQNSGVLILGEILRNVLSMVSVFFMARFLGAYDFGVINYAFTYLYFFEILPRFGFDPIVGRELAKESVDKALFLGNAMMLRFFFSFAGVGLALLGMILMGKPIEIITLVFLASLSIFFTLQISYEVVLRTMLEMRWAVLFNLVKQLIYLGLVLIGAVLKCPLWYFVLATLVSGFWSLLAYKRIAERFIKPVFKWDLTMVKILLRESWPIAISGLMAISILRFGVILLEKYKGFEAVGKYSAAYKFIEAVFMIPGAWVSSLYPLMSKFYGKDMESFKKISFYGFKFLVLMAIPICSTMIFYAPQVIRTVYGQKYEGADFILQILSLMVFFSFLNYVLAILNFATGRQKAEMKVRIACCGTNILMNLLLIPRFSYLGCAVALFLSEAMYSILCLLYLGKYVLRKEWRRIIIKMVILTAGLYGFFVLFRKMPFIPVAITGVIGFFSLMFVVRVFDRDEREMILKVFSKYIPFLDDYLNV